jgi:undecaprenyl-diphosphatase
MALLKWLDHLDRSIFRTIQQGTSPFLDWLMPWLREPTIWIPLYAFMLYYAFRATRTRGAGGRASPSDEPSPQSGRPSGNRLALLFILLSIITVALTDSIAAQVLKPLFGRLRPCHDPEMQMLLRNLVGCGGLYSMPSNHAANHFGLAAFWYFAIRSISGRKWLWLWLWAALICYAQVYIGKHYPFDVLVGAIFGTLTGWGMSRLFIFWNFKRNHLPGGSSS